MTEVSLSNNLKQIEIEIQWHKENAGKSVWEIGRRLNHVKESDLTHGQFIEWIEGNLDISRRTASKFMKVARELEYGKAPSHLGTEALYLIATLPEEEREKEHTLSSGDMKKPDEMTTRELKEIKKQLKEKENQLKQAKRSEKIALDHLEREQNKEPEVVEKIVEKPVIPKEFQEIENSEKRFRAENRRLTEEVKRLKKLEKDGIEVQRIEQTIEQLNKKKAEVNQILDANDKLMDLEKEFNHFFDSSMAPLKYKPLVNQLNEFNGIERMQQLVNLARAWVEDMDQMLPSDNRRIIEGEIINDEK